MRKKHDLIPLLVDPCSRFSVLFVNKSQTDPKIKEESAAVNSRLGHRVNNCL